MSTTTKAAQHKEQTVSVPPIIFFDGDKGGVGKSWACCVFADWLQKRGISAAIVDGDTQNPDVDRMFADSMPVLKANLRAHEGWMDLTDYMFEQQDKTIVVSLPAGIGADFRREAPKFFETVKQLHRPVSMFWVINRLPDSINLLSEALDVLGDQLKSRFVIKNLFFGNEDKFSRWENSETKKRFEKMGGNTICMSELHERTVDKLFADPTNVMPFSSAVVPVQEAAKSAHNLTPSENMELIVWLQENHRVYDQIRPALAI